MTILSKDDVQTAIDKYIDSLADGLRMLNQKSHENPELAYEEHIAHDAICDFLQSQSIQFTRHAYGLSTAFEAKVGNGNGSGRCVNFNAEYDALPGIGHACGHNLIAISSITEFLALVFAIREFGISGHAQLLGTPAEEDGGGKLDLINAGAYHMADVSLMMYGISIFLTPTGYWANKLSHPIAGEEFSTDVLGIAGRSSIACYDITAVYHGVSAHASASPWEGVNALDALVTGYNTIFMLCQQIKPDERVHGAILEAPNVTNAIPEITRTKYSIHSPTMAGTRALGERVRKYLESGTLATGCMVGFEENQIFADLVVNPPLCESFQESMAEQGERISAKDGVLMSGSTDQGNVSQLIPSLHGLIGIPVDNGTKNHTRQFTAAAGTSVAHERMIITGKAMAITGWRILVNEELYGSVLNAFTEARGDRIR
ncbi:hypothetical protein N7508_009954 [Penicillium antarcticum]|uniref:uncharacterized protein n=1 Tax=Penicillium antarcticum TaxID=416450 RepID=UPI002387F3A1|nr:uncharacterized protein N7508_009954 [Penicillium antarcticum]KAJ5295133.1 hypothetical protein N7508_009954 [Penicillium antarcticum]